MLLLLTKRNVLWYSCLAIWVESGVVTRNTLCAWKPIEVFETTHDLSISTLGNPWFKHRWRLSTSPHVSLLHKLQEDLSSGKDCRTLWRCAWIKSRPILKKLACLMDYGLWSMNTSDFLFLTGYGPFVSSLIPWAWTFLEFITFTIYGPFVTSLFRWI